MPRERITDDALARLLAARLGARRDRARLTGATGAAGGTGDPPFSNPMAADGDLIRGGESGAPVRLPVGADGQVLTVVSGLPAWADNAAGYTDEQAQDAVGFILQDTASIDFTYDDATPAISAQVIYAGTGSASTAARSDHTHQNVPAGLTVVLDGGGQAITTSQPKPLIRVPYACTVTAWHLNADQSGSIVVDVQRAASGMPTSFSSIAGTEKPTLSSQQSAGDTNLTTWTTSLNAGDWLRFVVESAATVQLVAVALHLTRTV